MLLGALPDGRASPAVIAVLARLAAQLPAHLRRSLTWDQGGELAQHAAFTVDSGCQVFFCDPHSPWQRGSNENTVSVEGGSVGPIGQAGAGNSG